MSPERYSAVCRCGETAIEVEGAPIESVTCYCTSCRTAGHGFERDPGVDNIVNESGGVDYCLYRKDWMTVLRGAPNLKEHRLKPDSPTRRVVASCCGSPMFLDFTPGHWVSVFRGRLPADSPTPTMSIMTRDAADGAEPKTAIPAFRAQSPRLMFKLLGAWAAMGFRRPKIVW